MATNATSDMTQADKLAASSNEADLLKAQLPFTGRPQTRATHAMLQLGTCTRRAKVFRPTLARRQRFTGRDGAWQFRGHGSDRIAFPGRQRGGEKRGDRTQLLCQGRRCRCGLGDGASGRFLRWEQRFATGMVAWLEKAAEAGNAQSMLRLGDAYREGRASTPTRKGDQLLPGRGRPVTCPGRCWRLGTCMRRVRALKQDDATAQSL